ncbi:MAG: hypothetical protein JW909_08705 [Planctomycetes bacterium]|nr:hypothetical protein [Planctomycetota bacterium]
MPAEDKDGWCCAVCGKGLEPDRCYIVRIEGFHTPETRDFSLEDIEKITGREIEELAAEIGRAGAEGFIELEEEVYKRYTFRMCRECYKRYISRPLPYPEDLY